MSACDHKAAKEWCEKYGPVQRGTTIGNLADAYLELRKAAKEVVDTGDWADPATDALRKLLEERP